MTHYLLDTDTLIDFSKGREPTRTRIFEMIASGDVLGICAVNVAEFYAGLPEEQHPKWNAFFDSLAYWEISREAGKRAGSERYQAARRGHALTTTDCLIAAVAAENNATILTGNDKDYQSQTVRVQKLRNGRTR